ncbi:potassium transporter KefB [candidate division BRC1 bacterium SM23_51]|nr:MAG: potassium transporter KefB [candidate division BRC1 bacterium SM23_51]
MGETLLTDFVVIFALALVVIFVCRRLRISTIVGFLLTGVLVGPGGLNLVNEAHKAELLSEIGIVLLLFTIGMELSLKTLFEMKFTVFVGGSLQVLLTLAAGATISAAVGQPFGQAVFLGFFLALSSTAIVLKLLEERAEMEAPHGRIALGILIFQDILVVPMVLLTPLLAGGTENVTYSLIVLLGKAIAVVGVTVFAARWLVPRILYQAARLRDRELFLLSVIVIGIGIAWLTSSVGLSLALGAFLAGLIISESEYSHRAVGNILPLRDVFTSFFFISVGMLLDIGYVARHPVLIVSLALGVMAVKLLFASFSTLALGRPLRTAILTGLALSQVGEFSFVLLKESLNVGLLENDIYQILIGVCVLTMLATPFVVAAAPGVADFVSRSPLGRRLTRRTAGERVGPEDREPRPTDHLVIVGFGLNGQNLARTASAAEIPYVIIEMNPQTVRQMRAAGEPIFYGDATQEAVLKRAGIARARVLVVAISDAAATRRTIELARRLNPGVRIIVRTRFIKETEPLYELGADEVIPEEFETSIEIFTRVMMSYLVPRDQIDQFIAEVRANGYRMFRTVAYQSLALAGFGVPVPELEVGTLRVGDGAPIVGKSLAELDLRKNYGVTVLAIRRGVEVFPNPGGDMQIEAKDLLFVLGKPEDMPAFTSLLRPPTVS